MKCFQKFAILFIVVLFLKCNPIPEVSESFDANGESPFPNTVFYQIYTRGFYDSNGDGLGDLNGITEKLDYIKDLGAGALWIMPIFKANTPHKYFATDFMTVDPEYGTNTDLKNLVKEAHERGLKVLIDFSINHANPDHAFFLDALDKGRKSKYFDFFHWVDDLADYNPETYSNEGVFDSSYVINYKKIPGKSFPSLKYYYARFLEAPDFNYDNEAVREYFLDVGRYWVGEIGIDGLRLDAARHIYDIESPMVLDTTLRNFIWWRTFCEEMKKINPEVFLLGEIWSGKKVMASYLKTGMDAVFNFPFSAAMLKSVSEEQNFGLVDAYLAQIDLYHKTNKKFGDATFLINHDTKRLISELDNNLIKAKLAVSILMTFPGSPFIYYGEELGYKADWPLLWLPMMWDEQGKTPGQTSWILGDSTIKNGILTELFDKKEVKYIQPLSVQEKDPDSYFNFYRTLIKLRANSNSLRNGKLIKSEYDNRQLISFIRESETGSLLIFHNISAKTQELILSDNYKSYSKIIYTNGGAELNGSKVYLSPYSSIILKN